MGEDTLLSFSVVGAEEGMRLDAFLASRHAPVSRNAFSRLIHEGRVQVNGFVRKPSFSVSRGQEVRVRISAARPSNLEAEEIRLSILFEDRDLVVVDKPPHMVVHPSPGHDSGTLVHALLYHCHDLSGVGGERRPGIVHRLDKGTSGVLVAAKNDLAHRRISRQFKDRTVKKTYLALVYGAPPADAGKVDLPLRRHPEDRKKMSAAPGAFGKNAETHWTVLERYEDAALLSVTIKTGRTHQIRVHMAAQGYPVIGDPVYAGKKRGKKLPGSIRGKASFPGRQMLHARRLCLDHPRTGESLEFFAPLPEDMETLVEAFRRAMKSFPAK